MEPTYGELVIIQIQKKAKGKEMNDKYKDFGGLKWSFSSKTDLDIPNYISHYQEQFVKTSFYEAQ